MMIRSCSSLLIVPRRFFHSSSSSSSSLLFSAAANGVNSSSSSSDSQGRVLIYGGNGALGKSLVHHFRREHWQVISVDFSPNNEAWLSITLHPETHWKDNTMLVLKRLEEKIGSSSSSSSSHHLSSSSSFSSSSVSPQPDGRELNVVINAAGGWAGGDIASPNFFHSVDQMWQVNALSALSTAYIAGQCMRLTAYPLVVFTGASPVFHGGTPGMVGYGVAKAAIHNLLLSMAAMPLHAPSNYTKGSTPPPALPSTAIVSGLLPITIDTPSNRAAMPNADFTQWTPPHLFAETVVSWALALRAKRNGQTIGDSVKIDNNAPHAPYVMPVNGGLYEFITKNGKTSIQLHELFGQLGKR